MVLNTSCTAVRLTGLFLDLHPIFLGRDLILPSLAGTRLQNGRRGLGEGDQMVWTRPHTLLLLVWASACSAEIILIVNNKHSAMARAKRG